MNSRQDLTAPSMTIAPARSNEEKFTWLFESYAKYVISSLHRLGSRPGDAEDLAHDVFIAVHKALETFDISRDPRPWLFAFAARVTANERRKRATATDALQKASMTETKVQLSPDVALINKEHQSQVETCLNALSVEQRHVFVMHEIDGIRVTEIADSLGLPLNTTYSRLRLARKRFCEALDALAQREKTS